MTDREAFEANMKARHRRVNRTSGGEYSTEAVEVAWAVWQSSRRLMLEEAEAAILALMPRTHSTTMTDVARNQGIVDCFVAIRSLATPTEGKT